MNRTPETTVAWQSDGPGIDGLRRIALPCPTPGAGEALVRVEAAALNFSDLLMLDDKYQIRPPRPFVPGQEVAGTVVAVGSDCTLEPGMRVAAKTNWGGFAGHALVRGDMTMPIPDALSFSEAATLPVGYTTAYVALTESTRIKPGETVLVLAAAGGVGLAAVEIAKHFGAKVIAAVGGADKAERALKAGADAAIDYRIEGWRDQVKVLTDGRGADIVLDPVGGDATLEALRLLAWEGRLLIVGFASGTIPAIPVNRLLLKRASAIGVYWSHDRDQDMLRRVAQGLYHLAETGAVKPHVGATFAFEHLPEALIALRDRKTTGKVIVAHSEETP